MSEEPKKIKSITIEFQDGSSVGWTSYKNARICEEQGMVVPTYDGESQAFPNGHRRLSILAWSGCRSYEDFVARGLAK